MYATMVACAFASCSKDDTEIVGPDGPDAEANATLEVKIARAKTKALPTNDANEDQITSLSLLVFNGTSNDAVLETIGTADGKGTADDAVKTAAIKPGNKKVIVLANIDLTKTTPAIEAGKTTFADFLTAQLSFANEKLNKDEGFTMNSRVYDITIAASKTNYMGYNKDAVVSDTEEYLQGDAKTVVKLYRNVAKIVMNKISFRNVNADQYPSATIALKSVFVLHGHANTMIAGTNAAQWGPTAVTGTYLNGASNTLYNDTWVKYMTTLVAEKTVTPVYNFIQTDIYAPEASYMERELSGSSYVYADRNATPFYVYENTESTATNETDYCTLLVVKADFIYKDVNGVEVKEENRYYPIAVGYNAAGTGNTTDFTQIAGSSDFQGLRSTALAGVLRNLQYVVNMTITGPGYETPFGPKPDGGTDPEDPENPGAGDTFLDAQVEVIGFADVIQNGEIE